VAYPVPGGNDTLAQQVLIGFQRTTLAPGQSSLVTFNVTLAQLADISPAGETLLHAGTHVVRATNGNLAVAAMPAWRLTVQAPAAATSHHAGALLLKKLPERREQA
jgi:hypothetical protein